jgi:glutathione synthase/RimK-type ligase-like ATP-grasp enzyme
MSTSKKVLVLFSFKSHKRGYIEMLFARLTKASQKFPLTLYRGSLHHMHIEVSENKLNIIESLTNRNLKDYDLLYFELWFKAVEQALAVALYAKRNNIKFFSQEPLNLTSLSKLGDIAVLADQGLPLPNTFISSRHEIKKRFKNQPPFPYPLIVKAVDAQGGKNNYLVQDYQILCSILDSNKDLQFMTQNFIPNDCDYRCLVMGGKIKLILKRTRDEAEGTHLNNTSQGGAGEVVALDALPLQARQDAIKAARLLNRDLFAGVDIVIDKHTRQHYILEVNQAPQIEIGAATDKKMEALLEYMTELTSIKKVAAK